MNRLNEMQLIVISILEYNRVRVCITMTTHGRYKTPEYYCWQGMKNRCLNSNHKQWEYYGGRGITMCDEWVSSFPQFLSDMGERPTPNHSLDRVDNDKGYCKENCQWRTKKEQMNNRRKYKNARRVIINEREYSLRELSEEYGVKYKRLCLRWERGIRGEELLKPPMDRWGNTL